MRSMVHSCMLQLNNIHWRVQNNGGEKASIYNHDIVDFIDGKGTTAVVEAEPGSKSTGTNNKALVKYNVNIEAGDKYYC